MAKATLNCIGWAFPYRDDEDKEHVHRLLIKAGFIQNGRKNSSFRKFWYNFRSGFRIEVPRNIVKISLTNAFYHTAMEVLANVNLEIQELYRNVVYAVSPTHYVIPEGETPKELDAPDSSKNNG